MFSFTRADRKGLPPDAQSQLERELVEDREGAECLVVVELNEQFLVGVWEVERHVRQRILDVFE